MIFAIPMISRLPKAVPYQVMGGRFINSISDCLDLIALAYTTDRKSPDYDSVRRQYLSSLTLRIESLKTAVRIFKRVRHTNHKGDLVPVVAPRHEAEFIDLINQISIQLNAWLGSKAD